MKKLFFGILFATLFTINLNGQQRTYKMKIIAKKNCVFSLQRNIVGIQASAILTVLQFMIHGFLCCQFYNIKSGKDRCVKSTLFI